MLDFAQATDEELRMIGWAIDALYSEQPDLVQTDKAMSDLIHAWAAEDGHRRVRAIIYGWSAS
jgi:hypothetical protein